MYLFEFYFKFLNLMKYFSFKMTQIIGEDERKNIQRESVRPDVKNNNSMFTFNQPNTCVFILSCILHA